MRAGSGRKRAGTFIYLNRYIYILSKLSSEYPNDSIGLYRNDGLAVFKNMNARLGDKAREVFCKILGDLGLKITVQSNMKIVNYLHVTLNLTTGKYYPFRKPYNNPLCSNAKSNHPPSIIRQIPASISTRISSLSCDPQTLINHHSYTMMLLDPVLTMKQ